MNQWNKLVAMVDNLFGFQDKQKSTIRKIGQQFDNRTGEHVIYLEYRVRRQGEVQTTPSTSPNQMQLLKAIHQRAAILAAANKNK